ncbi:MAG: NAD(P)-dependent oxidoreductase [Deinococcus sp.]|nr:NAD(P)-dependent oxidoreductase [Deinococcus sp.]
MARIFLTGATACVGHYLADVLSAGGQHQLDVLVRDPARLRPVPAQVHLTPVVGDLADVAPLAPRLRQADYLIHAAAERGGDLERGLQVNVEGTLALLAALDPSRVRRVFYFSSASLLRSDGSLVPAELLSDHSYLLSKYRAYVALQASPLRQRIVTLFPTLVYGWDQNHPPAHDSISLRALLPWAPVLARLHLDASFHYIHAQDIARIVRHLLTLDQSGVALAGRYVLGNPLVDWRQCVRAFTGRAPRPWFTVRPQLILRLAALCRIRLSRFDQAAITNPHFDYDTVHSGTFGLPATCATFSELLAAHTAKRRA